MKSSICFGVAVSIIGSLTTLSIFLKKVDVRTEDQISRSLSGTRSVDEVFLDLSGTFPDRDVCVTFPKVHDTREAIAKEFYERLSWTIKAIKYNDRTAPQIKVLKDGANFAFWSSASASAWEERDGKIMSIEGPGWIYPRSDRKFKTIEVEGDFAGFSSVFPHNFGHIIHDHLPVVAWFLTKVHPTTKFILHYDPNHPVAQHIYKVVDESFYNRIVWVPYNTIVHVKRGSLNVLVVDKVPTVMGTIFMSSLRKWLIASHPEANDDIDTIHPHGVVIFYSRVAASNVLHGRIVEPDHEVEIIRHIKQAMIHYGRREDFVVYNGMNPDGTNMSLNDQFKLFRRAKSVIGPHGSGLANMVWLNFEHAGSSCEKRPKVLEFVSGPDSEQVQHRGGRYNGYNLIFRGMPIDYHNILYTKESSKDFTLVHLEALDQALHSMWADRSAVISNRTIVPADS